MKVQNKQDQKTGGSEWQDQGTWGGLQLTRSGVRRLTVAGSRVMDVRSYDDQKTGDRRLTVGRDLGDCQFTVSRVKETEGTEW